jgi:HD-GYP domain-containing protein (c-di-GMP phosphodiesterase class II)
MKKPRRKHSKIAALPGAINKEVNRLLTTPGWTYEKIAAKLAELGHPVGKSSVGRYGQDFLARLQRLREVKEQAKAILDQSGGNGLEMEEAASQIALQRVMEFLMELQETDLKEESVNKMITALARLQQSSAMRERQKDLRRKLEQVGKEAKEIAKKSGLSDEKAEEIRRKIMGITG